MNPKYALLAAVLLFSAYTGYRFYEGHRLLEEVKRNANDPNFKLTPYPEAALTDPAIKELNEHCLAHPDQDVPASRQADFCRCLATNFVAYVHPKLTPDKRNLRSTLEASEADFAVIGGGLYLVTESCRKAVEP